jgi:hypothetical protein
LKPSKALSINSAIQFRFSIRLHKYNLAAQTFVRQTTTFDGSEVHAGPFSMRYYWPEQIDEMARQLDCS